MKRFLTCAVFLASIAASSNAAAVSAGRTPGSAAVSPSGAATYSVPLWTPPGIRGLAPSLALVYSSRAGDGLAGIGFNVAFGQSTITRCDQTIVQDGATSGAALAATDKFCLDGNRLRLTSAPGTYGLANSTYQTELETFSRITAKSTAGTGPQWFEVWAKNGLVYEYGNTADSRIESNLTAGGQTSTVRAWTINKIRDRTGNSINFTYIDDTTNGSFRPDKITWAGNSNTALADRYRIQFVYETPNRPDPIYSYLFGNASGVEGYVNEFKRLDRIDVYREIPTVRLLRRYDLTFDPGGGMSGRSRLLSFVECGGSSGTDCLSPTTFDWQNGIVGVASSPVDTMQAVPTGVIPFVMDINGDGRDDIVFSSHATSGSGTWKYMLANATGGYGALSNTGITNTNHAQARPIQWDGDDKWDLLVPSSGNVWQVMVATGSGFSSPVSTTVSSNAGSYWVADIDGDGRGDLVRATNVSGVGKVYTRLRAGSNFSSETLAIDMASWGGGSLQFTVWGSAPLGSVGQNMASSHKHPDFDGDGREDFILSVNRFDPELGTNTQVLYIVMGRGSTVATGDTFSGLTSLYDWRYGDFNGDGKTDIGYGNGAGLFYYAFSRGTSLFANTIAIGAGSPHIVMDYDGDGKDDLVTGKTGSTTWWFARSTGWSLSTSIDTAIPATPAGSSNAFVGDAGGEAQQDIVYRDTADADRWKLRAHLGSPADLLLTATDGFGVEATFAYETIAKLTSESGCYARDAAAPAFPVRAFRGDLTVACTLTTSDGIGGTFTQNFTYFNADLHQQGRGFLGFGKLKSVDSRNALVKQTTFGQTFPHIGMPLTATLFQPNGTTKMSETVNTLQSQTSGTGFDTRVFPYVGNAVTDNWESEGARDGAWTSRKIMNVSVVDRMEIRRLPR